MSRHGQCGRSVDTTWAARSMFLVLVAAPSLRSVEAAVARRGLVFDCHQRPVIQKKPEDSEWNYHNVTSYHRQCDLSSELLTSLQSEPGVGIYAISDLLVCGFTVHISRFLLFFFNYCSLCSMSTQKQDIYWKKLSFLPSVIGLLTQLRWDPHYLSIQIF